MCRRYGDVERQLGHLGCIVPCICFRSASMSPGPRRKLARLYASVCGTRPRDPRHSATRPRRCCRGIPLACAASYTPLGPPSLAHLRGEHQHDREHPWWPPSACCGNHQPIARSLPSAGCTSSAPDTDITRNTASKVQAPMCRIRPCPAVRSSNLAREKKALSHALKYAPDTVRAPLDK